jgi:hypothetical protein
MSISDRPPRDITPRGFFEQWLPSVFAARFAGPRRPAMEVRVRVILDGEGGGGWDLEVRGATLTVSAARAEGPAPPVVMRQTVADFRAVIVGEEGTIDIAPPEASPFDLLFLDPTSRDLLDTVRGTLRFEVTGYHGRTWSLVVSLGGVVAGATPDATIGVDAETYAKLRARTMQPSEADFAGKIHIAGDQGLAMQAGMALLPRFTR